MEDFNIRTCKKCNSRVDVKSMKYDRTGRNLICPSCYAKEFGKRIEDVAPVKKAQKQTTAHIGRKKRYVCNKCSYKFKYDPFSDQNLKCPYCGSKSVTLDEGVLDKLIRDSDLSRGRE